MSQKFIIQWDHETHVVELDNLIGYYNDSGYSVSHVHTNLFDFLQLDVATVANEFLEEYHTMDKVDACKLKFLADTLQDEPIKTVFTVLDCQDLMFLSKGKKKVKALALSRNYEHDILVISPKSLGTVIENDDQLYDLLTKLDPAASTFSVKLYNNIDKVYDNFYCADLHIIENVDSEGQWFTLTDRISELYEQSRIQANQRFLFLDQAIPMVGSNVGYDPTTFSDFESFKQFAETSGCDTVIAASKPTMVSPGYIEFVRSNFKLDTLVRFGYNDTMFVFNNVQGATLPIPGIYYLL